MESGIEMARNEIKIDLVPPSPILLAAVLKTSLKNSLNIFIPFNKSMQKKDVSHLISVLAVLTEDNAY